MLPLAMRRRIGTGRKAPAADKHMAIKNWPKAGLIYVLAAMIWLADIWLNADGHNRC